MPIISGLVPSSHRPGYIEVEVDGALLGTLPERLCVERGLAPGMPLDDAALADLETMTTLGDALALANRYLAHRPRAAAEVRARLRRERFDSAVIEECLRQLEREHLLDDRRFASLWVENRVTFSPRSARSLQQELRAKGIEREVIDDTLAGADTGGDLELALEAGRRRLHAMGTLDEVAFQRRMGGFLARRGFGYEVASTAVKQLWAERAGDT